MAFVGGGSLFIVVRARSGLQASDWYKIFGGLVIANLVIEIPILKLGGLYEYWGRDNQPLWHAEMFPMPLWFVMINSMLLFVLALVIIGFMSTGQKHVEWAIPVVLPGAMFAAYGLAGWPVILALQNGNSLQVTTICGIATVALSIGFTIISAQILPLPRSHVVATPRYIAPQSPGDVKGFGSPVR